MKECLIRIAFTSPQMPAKKFFFKTYTHTYGFQIHSATKKGATSGLWHDPLSKGVFAAY